MLRYGNDGITEMNKYNNNVATQCFSQCSTRSMCTGLLDPNTSYICSCQYGYESPTNDGKNCSVSLPSEKTSYNSSINEVVDDVAL